MKLSESEVYGLAFNRNISENLIKGSQIEAAKQAWLIDYFGEDFIDDIEDDEDSYSELIEDHLKHIWAWGVLHNNFTHIAVNITDKGIIQLLVEGTANVMDDRKLMDAKSEIKANIHLLLRRAARYCQAKYDDDDSLYENYDGLQISPQIAYFYGNERVNKVKY